MDQPTAVYRVGKREFLDSLLTTRTLITGALFLFAVGLITFGILTLGPGTASTQEEQVAGTRLSFNLFTLAVLFFAPIIGLATGYDTVADERISGTLALILSKPVRKESFLVGKFAGRAAAVAVPIIVGLGIGLAAASLKFDAPAHLIPAYIGLTLLLVWVFQGIGQLFSTVVKSSSTAVLGGIGLWVLLATPLWGLVHFGLTEQLGLDGATAATLNPAILFFGAVFDLLGGAGQGPASGVFSTATDFALPPWAGLVLYLVALVGASVAIFHFQDEA